MLGKRNKTTILAVLLLIVAMFATVTTVEAREVVRAPLITGQQTGFWLYSGDTVEINYYPYQQGNKMFFTWHESLYHLWYADDPKFGLTKVDFYWKDMSNPNDQWHHWRTANVEYYWPKTTQNLYSGSSSIGYKFVYKTYSDGIYIHAIVQ